MIVGELILIILSIVVPALTFIMFYMFYTNVDIMINPVAELILVLLIFASIIIGVIWLAFLILSIDWSFLINFWETEL